DMLRPLFNQLGFSAGRGDNDDRRALRAAVVRALGTTGNDSGVIRQARAALDRALAAKDGNPDARLNPTMTGSLVKIAAAHGDERLYEALTAAAAKASSPAEHNLFFNAAAD